MAISDIQPSMFLSGLEIKQEDYENDDEIVVTVNSVTGQWALVAMGSISN